MAMKIIEADCSVCGTGEFGRPNSAIRMKGEVYIIDAAKWGECAGVFDSPNCVSECPADCIAAA